MPEIDIGEPQGFYLFRGFLIAWSPSGGTGGTADVPLWPSYPSALRRHGFAGTNPAARLSRGDPDFDKAATHRWTSDKRCWPS
jgi:hypothetical protein